MINITIAINRKYVRYAYVMLTSLFYNNRDVDITVYILQSDLTEEDKVCISRLAKEYGQNIVYVDVNIDRYMENLPTTQNWTKEIYYRLLVGELLPDSVERLLYMDVDIIVHNSIEEFYHMDMQGNDLVVADDTVIQGNYSPEQQDLFADREIRYFNSGMILYDLRQIRQKYCFDDYCKVAEQANYRLSNPDQDLLNYIHAGKVLYADNERYNAFSQNVLLTQENADEVLQRLVIIHYAGRKPWRYNGVHYELEKLWWLYAKETPFYAEMMEEVFWDSLSDDTYRVVRELLEENKGLKNSLEKAMDLCQKLYHMEIN